MRYFRLVAVVLVAVGLFGCASGVAYNEFKPTMPESNPETGRIFFYRPSAAGAAIRPSVMLNGEKVGDAVSHGFFYVDRQPGDYLVLTSTEVERKLSFVLEKGQTRYVRFKIGLGFFVGHVYGELAEENEALEELQGCKYTGASQ